MNSVHLADIIKPITVIYTYRTAEKESTFTFNQWINGLSINRFPELIKINNTQGIDSIAGLASATQLTMSRLLVALVFIVDQNLSEISPVMLVAFHCRL